MQEFADGALILKHLAEAKSRKSFEWNNLRVSYFVLKNLAALTRDKNEQHVCYQ
jgi:hypothetical protein